MVQGSRWTLVRPYLRNISAVQSLASLSWGEPVRRGPMASERCSRFWKASLWSWTSMRMRRSAAAKGSLSSGVGRARPARTPKNMITAAHKNPATRREFIPVPLNEIEMCDFAQKQFSSHPLIPLRSDADRAFGVLDGPERDKRFKIFQRPRAFWRIELW